MSSHCPPYQTNGYLIQSKLADFLKFAWGASWVGSEIPVFGNKKYRWDMGFRDEGDLIVVEFDGDRHYRDPFVMKHDSIKDELADEHDCFVVRFPFWIQLSTETVRRFFNVFGDVTQDHPHGFITSRYGLPASFCEAGIERFKKEMAWIPDGIRRSVAKSIRDRIAEHGIECVLPPSLIPLLESWES